MRELWAAARTESEVAKCSADSPENTSTTKAEFKIVSFKIQKAYDTSFAVILNNWFIFALLY